MAELTNDFITRQMTGTAPHTSAHIYKLALFPTDKDATYATYSSTGEVANGNGYTTGGKILGTPTISTLGAGTSGCTVTWDFTGTGAGEEVSGAGPYTVQWTAASFTAQCAVVYNSNLANAVVCVIPFASATATNGNFTITLPTAGAGTSMVSVSN